MTQFVTYAQNREDVILQAYLKDVVNGTYVDIGAHHPVNDSVTKHFYDNGWRGINVEPNEDMFALIREHRPDDINVQAGISDKNGELNLRIYANSGLSTFTDEIKQEYTSHTTDKTKKFKDISVPVMTLKELFEKHPLKHIHFMKVDVEGFEYQVLKGNDWSKYRPEIICIEADHKVHNWRPLLIKNNYEFVWNDGLNDYYLAKESQSRAKNFYYPETMLLSEQILPHHVVDAINSLDAARSEGELKRQILSLKIEYLQNENELLQHKLQDQRRIKNASKTLVTAIDKAVRFHIDNLQYPAKKGNGPRVRNVTIASDAAEAKSLVEQLQMADLASHYSTKGIADDKTSPVRTAAYQTARLAYYGPRKLAKASYRKARGIKRGDA